MITQNLDNIPKELVERPRWFRVNHNKTPKISGWNLPENQKKADEVPAPRGFDLAMRSPVDKNYLVFDLDHVLTETGDFVTSKAERVTRELEQLETYVEYSQSGRGLHFVVRPTQIFPPMNPKRFYLDSELDKPENQRAKLEIFYRSPRYIIFTGDIYKDKHDIVSGAPANDLITKILSQEDKEEPTTARNQEQDVDRDRARALAMLEYIDPSRIDYQDWFNVCVVLKGLGLPFSVFDEWSSQDEKRYNKKKTCLTTWNSITREELTIATLHKLAMEHGYRERRRQMERYPGVSDYLRSDFLQELNGFRSTSKIKTGFQNLDEIIGGVTPGLYIIGAIPSLGKTTLMHQMADNIAEAGEYVLFFSLEQETYELVSKSIARESYRISKESALTEFGILRGYDDPNKRALFERAKEEYSNRVGNNLVIVQNTMNVSIENIVEFTEKFIKNTGRTPVVIIDYLQKITVNENLSDKQRVDRILSGLKQLQSRNKIPLFVISSFNRMNYMQVADFESFKESGDIEYSADAVWALQLQILNSPELMAQETGREGVTKSQKRLLVDRAKDEDPRRIELKALKHRGHPRYSVKLLFHASHCYFEPEPKEEPIRTI